MKQLEEMSLTDALLSVWGITHTQSRVYQKRDLFAHDGRFLGSFDSGEAWEQFFGFTGESVRESESYRQYCAERGA